MKKNTLFLFLASISTGAWASTDRSILSGNKACHAQVFASNAIVTPRHCIQDTRELVFTDLGRRSISTISPVGSGDTEMDSMVLVKFKTPIFENADRLSLSVPKQGAASVIHDGKSRDCRILDVHMITKTFEHTCAGNEGDSGLLIHQDGKPVGFHLGLVRSNVAIAAMDQGPSFAALPERFAGYRPQGFKISCCKKAGDAVKELGDAVASGVEGVKDFAKKTIDSVKAEIDRVNSDIAKMPKVFSSEYVQEKVTSIRMPKLPEMRLDDSLLKGNQFKWDLPDIKINTNITLEPNRNSVMGKILSGLTPVVETVDKGLTDVRRETIAAFGWILERILPSGGVEPEPKCNTDSKLKDKEECIRDLEAKIEAKVSKMRDRRNEFATWIFVNKSLSTKN